MSSENSPAGNPQIVVQQAPTPALGKYGRYLLLALGAAVMIILGQAASYRSYFSPPGGPQEKYHSLDREAKDKIAILRIEGAILDSDGFVKQQIDRIREDNAVKAVVLRIDSPGGTVTASDYLYHALRKLADERELPLVVSMGSICASGGYYLAMAAGDAPDVVFAEPSTWTGSIGVVIPHYDLSGLLAQYNVRDDSVASHPNKLMGSPTRELKPEERAAERELLQTLVDESFERFKNIVRSGRPKLAKDDARLEQATTGQIFSADQAKALGLVDRIGFLDEAIARAAELADRDVKSVRAIKYDQPPTTLSSLLSADGGSLRPAARFDLAQLLDLTAPRAFYLCTWLPSLLGEGR
ncbi:MAG: signal peptide peptidase SppA [Pirellulales bacterium]|nr:signal peptide peptidase SppA [Pirellulales bacterium]